MALFRVEVVVNAQPAGLLLAPGDKQLVSNELYPLLMTREVKETKRRRGVTRISTQNQVTLPTDALAQAGLSQGDRLRAHVQSPGQILLVRETDPIEQHAGALTGVYPQGYLEELRREWR